MASLTQWTWVWVGSRNWWWTGRPGLLWFMGLKRVRHDWATELNWTELKQFGLWQWGAIKGFWAKWNMNVGFFENIYRAISLSRKTHPLSAIGKIILENFLRLKAFSFLIPAPILPLLKSSKFRDWISFISPNTKPSYSIPKEKKKKTILFFLLMIFNVDQLLKSLLNLLQYCFWVLFFFFKCFLAFWVPRHVGA